MHYLAETAGLARHPGTSDLQFHGAAPGNRYPRSAGMSLPVRSNPYARVPVDTDTILGASSDIFGGALSDRGPYASVASNTIPGLSRTRPTLQRGGSQGSSNASQNSANSQRRLVQPPPPSLRDYGPPPPTFYPTRNARPQAPLGWHQAPPMRHPPTRAPQQRFVPQEAYELSRRPPQTHSARSAPMGPMPQVSVRPLPRPVASYSQGQDQTTLEPPQRLHYSPQQLRSRSPAEMQPPRPQDSMSSQGGYVAWNPSLQPRQVKAPTAQGLRAAAATAPGFTPVPTRPRETATNVSSFVPAAPEQVQRERAARAASNPDALPRHASPPRQTSHPNFSRVGRPTFGGASASSSASQLVQGAMGTASGATAFGVAQATRSTRPRPPNIAPLASVATQGVAQIAAPATGILAEGSGPRRLVRKNADRRQAAQSPSHHQRAGSNTSNNSRTRLLGEEHGFESPRFDLLPAAGRTVEQKRDEEIKLLLKVSGDYMTQHFNRTKGEAFARRDVARPWFERLKKLAKDKGDHRLEKHARLGLKLTKT